MYFVHMASKSTLCLEASCASFAGLGIDKGARVGFDLEVLGFDVYFERLLFPERLITWRKLGAVVFRLVHILVSLQPAVGGETLPTPLPIARVRSFGGGITMGVFQVSLEMVFPRKCLVTAWFGAGERSFLVVAPHMGLEATWSVEALRAALHRANIVPLPARLAFCSPGAIVGVVDLEIARRIGDTVLVRGT